MGATPQLRDRIDHHLEVLVDRIGARPPGSPANRRACDHAAAVLRAAGLHVREDPFTTRWWEPGTARLEVRTPEPELRTNEMPAPNPYSPAGTVEGPAEVVGDPHALARLRPDPGRVLVLTDTLAETQLLPACFPFLEDPAHTEIRRQLHRLAPAAVVAVSDHWEPILEDPDLAFPSVTIPTAAARGIAAGDLLRLEVTGAVHDGEGVNVSARTTGAVHDGEGVNVSARTTGATGATGATDAAHPHPGHGRRLVLCAHLDTKATTPGAFDNAGSVAVLLALAETGALDDLPVEVVLCNGEDHVDACGEVAWLTHTDLDEVVGAVNLDGIGLRGHGTSLAYLACPPKLAAHLDGWRDARPGWVAADPWLGSDHAIFALQGIPAVAITSEDVHALLGGLAHTPADTREVVDLDVLLGVAGELPRLLSLLARQLT